MTFFIGQLNPLLGLLAFFAYFVVGVLIPVEVAKNSGNSGIHYRNQAGALSAFVLDSLRGLSETQQYNAAEEQVQSLKQQSKNLSIEEAKMKSMAGKNAAITNSVILVLEHNILTRLKE